MVAGCRGGFFTAEHQGKVESEVLESPTCFVVGHGHVYMLVQHPTSG